MSLLEQLRGCKTGALLGAALVIGMFATGCGDDDDDDGGQQDFGTASLALEAISNQGTAELLELQDPQGTVYTVTNLQLAISQIELHLPDNNPNIDCSDVDAQVSGRVYCDNDEVKIDGPILVNLLTGETQPDLSDVVVPAVGYDEINIEVDNISSDDTNFPERMRDYTVRMSADFERDNAKRELDLRYNFKTEAKLGENDDDSPTANLLDGDRLVVQFDVTQWFNDVPITQCLNEGDLKTADGRVILDDEVGGECSDGEDEFETNFEESLRAIIERPS